MKSKSLLLAVYGLFIAISLVQFSCSSSKKSAVRCPDFSRSRNMKRGHAQLRNVYPDQQERYRINLTREHQARLKDASKISEDENLAVSRYPVPASGQAIIYPGNSGVFSYVKPARAQRVSLVIPPRKHENTCFTCNKPHTCARKTSGNRSVGLRYNCNAKR